MVMNRAATLLVLITLSTGLLSNGPLFAQADSAGTDWAKSFAEVHREWKRLDARLSELIKEYRDSGDAKKKELVTKYGGLVRQSMKLLPVLRETGLAAYKEAPNADGDVTAVLVGLVANDVRADRYESALSLASVLLDNKCTEPSVHAFAGIANYCIDDFESAEAQLLAAKEVDALTATAQRCLDELDKAKELWDLEQALRQHEAKTDDLPRVILATNKGEIVVELYENEAPQAVGNFVSLVESGFYNGLTFHRVLPGFMAQGGCPDGDGRGGPGYKIYCECEKDGHRKHFRGSLSMAHAGQNTGGSQFFLTFKRTPHLDGKHTVFGRVIEGVDVLAKLQRRDPSQPGSPEPDKIVKAEVLRKRNHEYAPTKVK